MNKIAYWFILSSAIFASFVDGFSPGNMLIVIVLLYCFHELIQTIKDKK